MAEAQQVASAPLIIVGTERSGSNLLRLILNAQSQITIPHPPHIMAYFASVEPYYGDLTDDVLTHDATMQQFGYQRTQAVTGSIGAIQRAWYRVVNELLRLRVEFRSMLEDRNQWRRWARPVRIKLLETQLKLGLR